jgi:hypothetical protein
MAMVDQQFENFAAIRSRILTGYGKVFALKSLPIEFRSSSPWLLESFVLGSSVVFCLGSWSAYQQRQTGLSAILLCFAVGGLLPLLSLHSRTAHPSELFEDRIVLRSLFKTEKIYRKGVSAVELEDIVNPRSGTNSSLVILKSTGGKP